MAAVDSRSISAKTHIMASSTVVLRVATSAARAGRISSIPSRALSSAVQRGAQDFHELRERSLLRYTLKASTEGDALSVIDAMDALCAWLRVEPARRDALTPRPRH